MSLIVLYLLQPLRTSPDAMTSFLEDLEDLNYDRARSFYLNKPLTPGDEYRNFPFLRDHNYAATGGSTIVDPGCADTPKRTCDTSVTDSQFQPTGKFPHPN